MEQIPSWKSNSFSANQEIPHILWNPKVSYRIHKRPLLIIPILYNLFRVFCYPDYCVFHKTFLYLRLRNLRILTFIHIIRHKFSSNATDNTVRML
jgi:hypothetical protein